MKYLFLLAVALIGFGSVYPLEFGEGRPFRVLLEPSQGTRGDLLQNLALFLPFGYLAMVAWRRPKAPLRFLILVAAAAIYAAALQVIQLWIPARDATFRDVPPNTIGAALGALVGAVPAFDVRRLGERTGRPAPLILVLCWLAYRLMPFVPSIDLQEWKDSVKPLRDGWRPFPWVGALHDAAAWLAVACLWVAAGRRLSVRWLPVLVALTFGLEVLIVDNGVSPASVLGAALGLVLAVPLARRPGAVAAVLAAAIVAGGLRPVEGVATGDFRWIPFGGFLGGSMLLNAQSLFEKAFLYGALVWAAREAGLRLAMAGAAAALLLAGVEAAQTGIPGHTPEVTDPLLALLAALFLGFADRPCPPAPPISLQSPSERKEDL